MKPSHTGRRVKRAERRWRKQTPKRPAPVQAHWLNRHEAEREQADEALAKRLKEEARHG
ncbi:MAG: hypothetical protein AB7L90_10280 [Hyphomicrobiaceae bacterium]